MNFSGVVRDNEVIGPPVLPGITSGRYLNDPMAAVPQIPPQGASQTDNEVKSYDKYCSIVQKQNNVTVADKKKLIRGVRNTKLADINNYAVGGKNPKIIPVDMAFMLAYPTAKTEYKFFETFDEAKEMIVLMKLEDLYKQYDGYFFVNTNGEPVQIDRNFIAMNKDTIESMLENNLYDTEEEVLYESIRRQEDADEYKKEDERKKLEKVRQKTKNEWLKSEHYIREEKGKGLIKVTEENFDELWNMGRIYKKIKITREKKEAEERQAKEKAEAKAAAREKDKQERQNAKDALKMKEFKDKWIGKYYIEGKNYILVTEESIDRDLMEKIKLKAPQEDVYVKAQEEKRKATAERAEKAAASRAVKAQQSLEREKAQAMAAAVGENTTAVKNLQNMIFGNNENSIKVGGEQFKKFYACGNLDLNRSSNVLKNFVKIAKKAELSLQYLSSDTQIEKETFDMMLKDGDNSVIYNGVGVKNNQRYSLSSGSDGVVYTRTINKDNGSATQSAKRRTEKFNITSTYETTPEENISTSFESAKDELKYKFYNVFFHKQAIRNLFTGLRNKEFDQKVVFKSKDNRWVGLFLREGETGSLFLQDNEQNAKAKEKVGSAVVELSGQSLEMFRNIFGFDNPNSPNNPVEIKKKIDDVNCAEKRKREGGDSSRSSSPAESLSSASESLSKRNKFVIDSDSDDEDDSMMSTSQKLGASILAGVF